MTNIVETSGQDVEMEVESSGENAGDMKKDQGVSTILEIREQVRQIERAVASKESRYYIKKLFLQYINNQINYLILDSF